MPSFIIFKLVNIKSKDLKFQYKFINQNYFKVFLTSISNQWRWND